MLKAKILVDGKEILLKDELTTIGRASDNVIHLAEDPNVSRYHAEIEYKQGRFWLTDLKSSNGTTVNGTPVTTTVELFDGDLIVLGGTSQIEFHIVEEESQDKDMQSVEDASASSSEAPRLAKASETEKVPSEAPKSRASYPLLIALFLALIVGFGLILAFFIHSALFGQKDCKAKAKILSPENGDLIDKEAEINLDVQNGECLSRVIVYLEDKPIVTFEQSPFISTINPEDFPEFADGLEHPLRLVVEDLNGKTSTADTVFVAFETASIEKPDESIKAENQSNSDQNGSDSSSSSTSTEKESKVSLVETQQMIQQVLKQFSGNFSYKFDEQFLQEVRKKTSEYAEEGYSSRAESYRDLINIEFYKENGLDAPLGFLLAMSRSKFNPQKRDNKEGLWQLSDEFLATNGYKTVCPSESLSDKTQSCAAKTAAIYTKALFLKIFNGDLIYAVAAFGMNEKEAFSWLATLPPNRADFWKVIKQPERRENVIRFFAAAIVAENPQRFNLKHDKPISELYRSLIYSPANR
jgi:hypothetical protein